MAKLNMAPNIARPDDLYDKLVELHEGLDDVRSAVVNAKLVLLLANHIGDEMVLGDAIARARIGMQRSDRG